MTIAERVSLACPYQIGKFFLRHAAKLFYAIVGNGQVWPASAIGAQQERRGRRHGFADDAMQVARALKNRHCSPEGVHPYLTMSGLLPAFVCQVVIPVKHVTGIEVGKP